MRGRLIVALILVWLMSCEGGGAQALGGQVFASWDDFEIDKCASIWLIRRFIDPEAVIRIYPRGETITEGIPFDIPDAKLRRYHNSSTFQVLVKHYGVVDERVQYLARIVHDTEINVWEQKAMPETPAVQQAFDALLRGTKDSQAMIEKCVDFFDLLYRNRIP